MSKNSVGVDGGVGAGESGGGVAKVRLWQEGDRKGEEVVRPRGRVEALLWGIDVKRGGSVGGLAGGSAGGTRWRKRLGKWEGKAISWGRFACMKRKKRSMKKVVFKSPGWTEYMKKGVFRSPG